MSTSNLLARIRTPKVVEVVQVSLTGSPAAVGAIARALASVSVVTGMRHQPTTDAVIRLIVTCHPVDKVDTGGRR